FSYVLEGKLEHRDSMGNGRTLEPGQIQLMSAGTGITHSERNPSATQPVHFLQIWIQPKEKGLTPNYTEWHPTKKSENEAKTLIISKDGRDGSAKINQDVAIYRIRLSGGDQLTHELSRERGLWLQIIQGSVTLNGQKLHAGDAASSETEACYQIQANDTPVEALLFDLG
ncbi:MAG: pirin family protein, partial [Verrucomicrobiota bacterium]